nr:unnamed protein product [Digitaria exilis]
MALVACPRYDTLHHPRAFACASASASTSGSRGLLLRAPRSAAARPRPRWRLRRRSLAMAAHGGGHSAGADDSHAPPSLLVFSGGTAFNGVVEELKKVTTRVAHVLPVSDDGGSTAEIVRVLDTSTFS